MDCDVLVNLGLLIDSSSGLQRVDCDVLVNLGLLINSSSGLQRVDCDVLVNLRAADSCVVMAKSTICLARYIPN